MEPSLILAALQPAHYPPEELENKKPLAEVISLQGLRVLSPCREMVSNRICVSSPHCGVPIGTAPAPPARQPLDLPRGGALAWGFLRPRA